jgi:chromosome segregation ATPase
LILYSKKFKELQSENEELKNQIESVKEKEERLKRFEELIKNARIEYASIALKKDQTVQKLEALENDKTRLNNEIYKISSEIKQLREIKLSEHNQLLALNTALSDANNTSPIENADSLSETQQSIHKEIEAAENKKNEIAYEIIKLKKIFDEARPKVAELKRIKNALNIEIEKKKEEISSLIERQKSVSHNRSENFNPALSKDYDEKLRYLNEIESRIKLLLNQETVLLERLSTSRKELEGLDKLIEEKNVHLNNENESKKSLEQLARTESLKKELIFELDIKIGAKEAQLYSLTEDYKSKSESLSILHRENEQLLAELHQKSEKLKRLDESIEISTTRLTDLDYSLSVLDQELNVLTNEVENKRAEKTEIETQINDKITTKVELEEVLKELRETTSILAQLKKDIEKGSGHSAKRFTSVLQDYSKMINEMYRRKVDIEKVLVQKEKDVNDKDSLIEERETVLKEMENVLYIRQHRLNLFEDLTRAITEQRKYLENGTHILEDTVTDKFNQQEKLILNNELPHGKLLEFENALKELLSNSDKYSADLISNRASLEKELIENKKRLNDLNQNIRNSTTELTDLRNSIDKIKIEHEDHRLAINKLAALKHKLEDDINKYQIVIDKYSKFKEMIRQEQELIKMKRELSASNKPPDHSNAGEKTFEHHNPNWVKL